MQGLVILSRNFACIMNVSRKSIVQVCLLMFYVFFVLGFLASRLSGLLVSLASQASWLLGCAASRLFGLLASWLLGFLASPASWLPSWLLGFSRCSPGFVTAIRAYGTNSCHHHVCSR